jgi:hypothetical protein
MTAGHVARAFWDNPTLASQVVCRFDCEYGPDGLESAGTPVVLATEYQVLHGLDWNLDFALLRMR